MRLLSEAARDNTLKLIAAELQRVMDENIGTGGSVTVEEVTGGTDNDRNILIIAPNPSIKMEVVDAQFTGGTAQPVVTIREVIPNTPSKETFAFPGNLFSIPPFILNFSGISFCNFVK